MYFGIDRVAELREALHKSMAMVRKVTHQELARILHQKHTRHELLDKVPRPADKTVARIVAQVICAADTAESRAWGAGDQNVELTSAELDLLAQRLRIQGGQVSSNRVNADVSCVGCVARQRSCRAARFPDLCVDSRHDPEGCI